MNNSTVPPGGACCHGNIAFVLAAAVVTVLAAFATFLTEEAEGQTAYGGPKTITAGGTYSGNWQSTDPSVPAVTVATTKPVVIERCSLRSSGNLVEATVAKADVTIRNCTLEQLHPGAAGRLAGYALFSDDGMGRAVIEHNRIMGTRGVL